MVRKRLGRLLAAASLGLLLFSCSGSDTESESPSDPTTSVAEPEAGQETPADSDEATALAVYLEYQQAKIDSANPADPNHPDIDRLMSGNAKQFVVEQREFWTETGVSLSGSIDSDTQVESLGDGSIRVEDCLLNQSTVSGPSGVIIEPREERDGFEAIVMLSSDGQWKVDDYYASDAACE